jgi:hypothetical protein
MFVFVEKKSCEFYIILELLVLLIANGWNCLVESNKTFCTKKLLFEVLKF